LFVVAKIKKIVRVLCAHVSSVD